MAVGFVPEDVAYFMLCQSTLNIHNGMVRLWLVLLQKDHWYEQPNKKKYSELGEAKAPYVHSVKHSNTLYISGMTAFGTVAQHQGIAE